MSIVGYCSDLLRRVAISSSMQSHWFVWWSTMVSMVLVLTLSSVPALLLWHSYQSSLLLVIRKQRNSTGNLKYTGMTVQVMMVRFTLMVVWVIITKRSLVIRITLLPICSLLTTTGVLVIWVLLLIQLSVWVVAVSTIMQALTFKVVVCVRQVGAHC